MSRTSHEERRQDAVWAFQTQQELLGKGRQAVAAVAGALGLDLTWAGLLSTCCSCLSEISVLIFSLRWTGQPPGRLDGSEVVASVKTAKRNFRFPNALCAILEQLKVKLLPLELQWQPAKRHCKFGMGASEANQFAVKREIIYASVAF